MHELLFSVARKTARLPDERMGDAYEATEPERRAWIKTTLALVRLCTLRRPSGKNTVAITPPQVFASSIATASLPGLCCSWDRARFRRPPERPRS